MMSRHSAVPVPLNRKASFQPSLTQPLRRWSLLAVVPVLAVLFTMACAFIRPNPQSAANRILILTRLPTLTRTPLPTLTPTSFSDPQAGAIAPELTATSPALALAPTNSPVFASPPTPGASLDSPDPAPTHMPVAPDPALATNPPVQTAPPAEMPIPTATGTPAPLPTPSPAATATETPLPTDTPTAIPTPQAWMFSGVRLSPNPYDDGLVLYGNLVNNTGAAQKLMSVLGTFYDTQNQVIAGPDSSESYSPAYVVAPGAGAPFELAVETIETAANFDLNVAAEPSDEIPRQDFEFSDIELWTDEGTYCVGGELKNHGGELHDYLVIALILYDSQENIISFSYYEELDPDWIEGDDQLEFELCSDVLEQAVTRHELQAWGR